MSAWRKSPICVYIFVRKPGTLLSFNVSFMLMIWSSISQTHLLISLISSWFSIRLSFSRSMSPLSVATGPLIWCDRWDEYCESLWFFIFRSFVRSSIISSRLWLILSRFSFCWDISLFNWFNCLLVLAFRFTWNTSSRITMNAKHATAVLPINKISAFLCFAIVNSFLVISSRCLFWILIRLILSETLFL